MDFKLKESFLAYDTDADGELSNSEIVQALLACGLVPKPKETDKFPPKANYEQFQQVATEFLSTHNAEKELLDTFKLFDRGGRGYIETEEIIQVLKALGEKVQENELEELRILIDPSRSTKCNYQDLMKTIFK